MSLTACFFLFQSTDKSECKRLATRDEVVISRVKLIRMYVCSFPEERHVFFFSRFFFPHFYNSTSGQDVVTGIVPFSPRLLPSIFIAHRVRQSHCSSIFHRGLLTHALLALSASQFANKKKSERIYTSMHSAGLELTILTYTRLEDNLIRHRGDRPQYHSSAARSVSSCCYFISYGDKEIMTL